MAMILDERRMRLAIFYTMLQAMSVVEVGSRYCTRVQWKWLTVVRVAEALAWRVKRVDRVSVHHPSLLLSARNTLFIYLLKVL